MATMASVSISSRQASISSFSVKGSPIWTVGRFSSESAENSADVHHRVAGAGRLGGEDAVGAGDAHRHGVDERVAVVSRVEVHLAAHRGDADAVAVAADAADHAVEYALGAGVVGRTEAERVEVGDGAGAHGEHVAQDAAYAGGGALVGLDEARVVVRLHLEHGRQAFADVDDAGVLAGALDDPGGFRRQLAQPHAG
jgi:hypothetical protein